ncbi:redox-regulated ATPase YchF [Helicobacter saguini]|uniref:Ribosome-binding ATPase YchF n=1 Tax=Helicobacter saguini TaxID=1548018 RepID=A0A347VTM5_9HELI|nr:redox-regulated ATPase YchF [Helicobacter saguini]MWV62037.1 redox-regulated ATPase YchF [Helicobacter saguini]MWV67290.1 redox-regulated ATPase YchF [Helicobacter saguini]MWV69643.1 redox-regulated ATPase YchF [Helicobacter saguini]MWV70806.1 redox-regulated ATPase YchF [Helicobacter saguini]TLD94353.1 redox-regulated ATPase YchF [Helicobacter saguini]
MALSIGIVGLPNVGKSTTFNALTKAQNAEAANYPFCTIEPNKAIVPVPDSRLQELAKIVNPQKIQHSTIEFVDIAGLVRGASKGEGLGNQFLANIKEADMILHIVRCFEDGNITHVENRIDPIADIEIIELELLFSDISSLQKRIEKLQKDSKAKKGGSAELDIANELMKHLETNKPVRSFAKLENEHFKALNKDLRFLTNKPIIYGANVDESGLESDNKFVESVRKFAETNGAIAIKLCAKIEEELVGLEDAERAEFLQSMGVKESGLEQIIRECFAHLGLISYFTAGVKEVRAWTIRRGDSAPRAASVIHKDFEKGFIRAECISFSDFIKYGGESKAKEAGAMRVEGKDYIVQDGDIMHFRFNV